LKNNILQYQNDLRDFILSGNDDETKINLLKEKIKSEVLRSRLFQCKQDNQIQKRRMISLIRFLTKNKQNFNNARSIDDFISDFDLNLSTLIKNSIKKFKSKTDSIPSYIFEKHNHNEIESKKEWNSILLTIIKAFELSEKPLYILTESEKKTRVFGLELFIKNYEHLWI